MILGYDLRIKFLRGILSGCSLAVQMTILLVISGKGRGNKQRNKRNMQMLNDKRKRLCRNIYSIRY